MTDRFVLVGASLAGLRAGEAARRLGYRGDIILIGEEDCLPYDRPPLTKATLSALSATGPDVLVPLRSREVLEEKLGVKLRLGEAAILLDTRAREVQTSAGSVGYDVLVIATGGAPAPPSGGVGVVGASDPDFCRCGALADRSGRRRERRRHRRRFHRQRDRVRRA